MSKNTFFNGYIKSNLVLIGFTKNTRLKYYFK